MIDLIKDASYISAGQHRMPWLKVCGFAAMVALGLAAAGLWLHYGANIVFDALTMKVVFCF